MAASTSAVSSGAAFQVRRARLASGLVLFAYVLTHFLNHAVGLISLEALETGRLWFLRFWREPVAAWTLYTALSVHIVLALWAIYQRRRLLHMPRTEATQLLLGLLIVPLLAKHVLGTRIAADYFDVTDSYTYVLLVLWHLSPTTGAQQAIALVVAWIHACIGLYFWSRLKPWYRAAQPLLFAGALLLPVLALLGFAQAGREVSALARDPEWLRIAIADINFPTAATVARIIALEETIWSLFAAALATTLLARVARTFYERRSGLIALTYPGGRKIEIRPGLSVLEASQLAGIPHASVCGGRGRCSTCRVRVSRGFDTLPPPSEQESAVLARVGAPPNVRLACQTRPRADLAVAPLLPPSAGPRDARARPVHSQGQEKEIAILFADLRGFTGLSEHKLPYDVVFVLNRYFAAMGQAIEREGGHVDKFIGDGVMALFGINDGPQRGAQEALAAARAMAQQLSELNQTLTHDLDKPLKIGIGIHLGPAIVGEMGYARAVSLTAIGDAVNTASRLEAMTKEHDAELVVSEKAAAAAGVDLSAFAAHDADIRGRRESLRVRIVPRAGELPDVSSR